MKLISVAFAAALLAAGSARAADCTVDPKAMLAMSPHDFDQRPAGWRSIGQRQGCETAGADLIAAYRAAHVELRADQRQGLNWHEGQLRAAAGDYAAAIPLLDGDSADDGFMGPYARATVAFLRRDRQALMAARADLAAVPEDPDFVRSAAAFKAAGGRDLVWPPNLDVVDGLIACFEKTYAEAYGACRPKP